MIGISCQTGKSLLHILATIMPTYVDGMAVKIQLQPKFSPFPFCFPVAMLSRLTTYYVGSPPILRNYFQIAVICPSHSLSEFDYCTRLRHALAPG